MHKLWRQYISELLRNSSNKEALLLDADYHGCSLTVVQSSNSAHVGLTGYVVTETSKAFAVLTQNDKLHHILKKAAKFQFTLDDTQHVTLFGSQLLKQCL